MDTQAKQSILDAHPLDYVVLVGDRLFAVATTQEEAFSYWDAAWDVAGENEDVVVVPPEEVRKKFERRIVRGRALAGSR